MKWFLKILLLFVILIVSVFPIGWYVFYYINVDIESSENIGILIPTFVFLLCFIVPSIRDGVIPLLTSPIDFLDFLEKSKYNKRIKKYKTRDYVTIKTKHNSQYKS